MNLEEQKIEAIYLTEFLRKNKDVLNIKSIERKCNMSNTYLWRKINSRSVVHHKYVEKLSSILKRCSYTYCKLEEI